MILCGQYILTRIFALQYKIVRDKQLTKCVESVHLKDRSRKLLCKSKLNVTQASDMDGLDRRIIIKPEDRLGNA